MLTSANSSHAYQTCGFSNANAKETKKKRFTQIFIKEVMMMTKQYFLIIHENELCVRGKCQLIGTKVVFTSTKRLAWKNVFATSQEDRYKNVFIV